MEPTDKQSEEEKRLIEQNQLRSTALTAKHQAEILECELNNASEEYKSKMLLRHASELSRLSQEYFNQWIDFTERQKKTG
ncbi:hypothetical protein [Dyadobacter sediminis]|uniref:Uncharacterized protein n=2 Tax=Dyadobacter sediminis TaxID=1493691 RepID=A0A5R9KIR6_9BACT|nr:hypothetical protein [Dyadobacter sediminis]TLU96074.1 hypothetical protein FEM55_02695 [Dyadobacter sediminis]GGB79030.1 hypothetical protein GCM10011325_03210 [Dyadobacter sediminis]